MAEHVLLDSEENPQSKNLNSSKGGFARYLCTGDSLSSEFFGNQSERNASEENKEGCR